MWFNVHEEDRNVHCHALSLFSTCEITNINSHLAFVLKILSLKLPEFQYGLLIYQAETSFISLLVYKTASQSYTLTKLSLFIHVYEYHSLFNKTFLYLYIHESYTSFYRIESRPVFLCMFILNPISRTFKWQVATLCHNVPYCVHHGPPEIGRRICVYVCN